MESLGHLVGALIWGIPVATLLTGSLVGGPGRAMAPQSHRGLERAENDAT